MRIHVHRVYPHFNNRRNDLRISACRGAYKNEYLERAVGRGGHKKKKRKKTEGNATSPVREWRTLTDVIWPPLCPK